MIALKKRSRAMIDTERMICICNGMSMKEIAELIKTEQITTMEELIEKAGVGDKCESCIEDGYENDGYSLAMVLSLVKQGRL
jgi:bacterioferritin-associated ferredoxin